MIQASIIGASGYAGGELLRILLGHQKVNLRQVTSQSKIGELVSSDHPNLLEKLPSPVSLAFLSWLFMWII